MKNNSYMISCKGFVGKCGNLLDVVIINDTHEVFDLPKSISVKTTTESFKDSKEIKIYIIVDKEA